jgi:hypothetical protein
MNFKIFLHHLLARSTGFILVSAGAGRLVSRNIFEKTGRAFPFHLLPSNGVAALTKTIPWTELSLGAFIMLI